MQATVERISEAVKADKLDEAQQLLSGAPPDALSSAEKHLCEGLIHEKSHCWEQACAAYEAAVSDDPSSEPAAFRLAVLADRFGDDDRATELYERCTREAPASANALINLAVLYEDAERYDDALNCLDRVLEKNPNHERALLFEKDVRSSMHMYYDEERERFREKRNAVLETPISDFELSVRSRNCLKQMDIHTLGDLLRSTRYELLSYKNFGETSLHEIEAMLSQKGLRLGQLLEEEGTESATPAVPPGTDPAKANLLNRSVAELELSVRSRKCLLRLSINSIGELTARSEPELLGTKNFGATSLAEIKRRLTEFGLSLKSD